MSQCIYFMPIELGCQVNCTHCKRWNGKRCRDEKLLREHYEESKEFEFYDRLIRENKGVNGPF